jgi:tetratricopeptide (TPR) repeat protein
LVSRPPLSDLIRKAKDDPVRRRQAIREAKPEEVVALLPEAKGLRQKEPAVAAMFARAALTAARASRAAPLMAQAARLLGQADLVLGHPRRAFRHLMAAAKALGPALSSGFAAEIAQTLVLLGRTREALEMIAQARRNLPEDVDPCERATLHTAEGNIHLHAERLREALASFGRARRILNHFCERGTKLTKLAVDGNRGLIYAQMNRYSHADRLLRRTARDYRRFGHEATALQVEHSLAYLQFLRGRFGEALSEIRRLRARFVEISDDRHVATCDLDEAELALRLGLHSVAADCARRAAQSFDRHGMRLDAARTRFFLAVATRDQAKPDATIDSLVHALHAFRAEGCEAWVALCLQKLAELEWERGDAAVAAERAQQASERFFAAGLLERGGRVEVLRARIEHELGSPDAAVRRLVDVEARVRGLDAPWLHCEIQHALGRSYEALRRTRKAVRHGLRAARILRDQPVAVPPDEHGAAVLRERSAIYEDAASLVSKLGGRRAVGLVSQLALDAQQAAAREQPAGREHPAGVGALGARLDADELSRGLSGGLQPRPRLEASPEQGEVGPEVRA